MLKLSFFPQFNSLTWGIEMCNIFLIQTFPYSLRIKYLLTESKKIWKERSEKLPQRHTGNVFWHKLGLKTMQSIISCCRGVIRLATWESRVVMTSNHSVCVYGNSHWDYYPPFIQVDKVYTHACVCLWGLGSYVLATDPPASLLQETH